MSKYIIDRRRNPSGKNLPNRQRFIKRTKSTIRKENKDKLLERSISDKGSEEVNISQGGISEPAFGHDRETGTYDFILPGNKEFVPGDRIPKPKTGGGGSYGALDGDGEDDFIFSVSRDEFLDILFEGLELPNMEEKNKERILETEYVRAGYTVVGTPAQLNLIKSVSNAVGRRIALRKKSRIFELERLEQEFLLATSEDEKERLRNEIDVLKRKVKSIAFIDPIDIRYNNFTVEDKPSNSAVMFCIMDVSGSMGEHEKELAKRFYILLYLFLDKKYEEVDVIFIRHHHEARECTEEEFFTDVETGGTVVSSGFELAKEIIQERYNPNNWNIYVAQASDGDNYPPDVEILEKIVCSNFLPIVKYFVYLEIKEENDSNYFPPDMDRMGGMYEDLSKKYKNITIARVNEKDQIRPIFREIFKSNKHE